MSKRAADSELATENDGTCDHPRKRTRKPKLSPSLYKASIKEVAETGVVSSTSDLDNGIIQRIKKCLDRANHPNTVEAEAKAALHLASRLMGQYNVSQAEVLAHETPDTQKQYAGQSVVSIRRVDDDRTKSVRHQGYVDGICRAMVDFFDCKSYTTATSSSLDITFYGIAENTVAASMSFEMAYNLIADWALSYKGVGRRNSYCLGVSAGLRKQAKNKRNVEEAEAQRAELDAIAVKVKQEEAERQAQLSRLAPLSEPPDELDSSPATYMGAANDNNNRAASEGVPSTTMSSDGEIGQEDSEDFGFDTDQGCYESSEDGIEPDFKVKDEDDVKCFGDLDEEISKLIKPEPAPEALFGLYSVPPSMPTTQGGISSPPLEGKSTPFCKTETGEMPNKTPEPKLEMESKWASHMQLVTFRATATKIAEEFIREKGVKLRNLKSRGPVIRDMDAYKNGVKDGKKIDVHRKRIKEE
jgi:hypothetical protein